MSEYEKQVVILIKFQGDYPDRQDYLAALIRATDKWLEKHDESGDIFDAWEMPLANWFNESVKAMHTKRTIPDFPDANLEETNEEEKEWPAEDQTHAGGDEGGDAVSEGDPVHQHSAGNGSGAEEVSTDAAPKAKTKRSKTIYDGLSGARDRFGIVIGTKTNLAVVLYELGTTAKEIMEKVGGRHYNILKKLEKDGHKVERLAGGGFKLTHHDDVKQ